MSRAAAQVQVENETSAYGERNGDKRCARHRGRVPHGEKIVARTPARRDEQQRRGSEPCRRRGKKENGKKERLAPHFDTLMKCDM